MTQQDFLACLESSPPLYGVPFGRDELIPFVASMWPHIEDDPDVRRWAGEFVEARKLRAGV